MKTLKYSFLIILIFYTNVYSKIYNYIDKDGIPHFTDNLANIPQEYQDKIQTNSEIKSNNNSQNISPHKRKKYKTKNKKTPQKNNKTKKQKVLSYDERMKLQAWNQSKKFALRYLKNPGSAIFPKKPHKIINTRSYEWEIVSYVDAQNDYGALKRLNFKIQVSRERSGKKWHLEKFTSW